MTQVQNVGERIGGEHDEVGELAGRHPLHEQDCLEGNPMRHTGWHTPMSAVVFVVFASAFVLSPSGCASTTATTPMPAASPAHPRITVLYDAFGKEASMKKDWGFAALVEVNGKRILFDTGDNPDIFAQNVKAAEEGIWRPLSLCGTRDGT